VARKRSVYVVFEECDDPFYGPELQKLFWTRPKAKKYVREHPELNEPSIERVRVEE